MNAPAHPPGPPVRDGKPYPELAHIATSVVPFVAIDRLLRERGFAAPEILAADLDLGLLLIEHLGSEPIVDREGRPIRERYLAAAGLLAELHGQQWPAFLEVAPGIVHDIPPYDRGALGIETELALDWYFPAQTGAPVAEALRQAFRGVWQAMFERLETAETSLTLRDFHSPNLIWREDHLGRDRLGLIDFQDALVGPAAYDLASLAFDTRATVGPSLESEIFEAYAAARGPDFGRESFAEAYAITAAQRNTKLLGTFTRLNARDGKPHYLKHLPRIRTYLRRALEHPVLEPVRRLYADTGLLEDGPA